MPSLDVDVGNGASLTFGTSTFTAEITSISIEGIERDPIDVTHLATSEPGAAEIGGREYILSKLADSPQLNIEGHFNPDTVPPVKGAPEALTLTFGSGAVWSGSGGMVSYNPSNIVVDGKMTFSAGVKFTGKCAVAGA